MDILVVSGSEILPYLAFIGVTFLVLEFLLPTKGILGVIGAFLFVAGTIILTTHPDPNVRISVLTCILLNVVVLGTAGTLFYLTYRGYTSSKGEEFDMKDKIAKVIDWTNEQKRIEVDGAIWVAKTRSNISLNAGQTVRIVDQENITLIVEPAGDN